MAERCLVFHSDQSHKSGGALMVRFRRFPVVQFGRCDWQELAQSGRSRPQGCRAQDRPLHPKQSLERALLIGQLKLMQGPHEIVVVMVGAGEFEQRKALQR